MHSHDWNCDVTHGQWECPYPISNVRVITSLDAHADEAIALVSSR